MFQQTVRRSRTGVAVLVIAGIAGFGSPAGARPTAAPAAYSVGVAALLNAQNRTDVTVTVKPTGPGTPVPVSARQIVLRAYAADGVTLLWTKAFANVPLNQGRASFVFTNLARLQLLRAQVVLQMSGPFSGEGRVFYRPDLAVQGPASPLQAVVGQTVSVAAAVSELRGDVGATFDVVLLNASNGILDTAPGLSVGLGGTVTVLLATQFFAAGTYPLAIEIRGSNPSEYDAANDLNNRATVMVVVTATIPTEYSMGYEDRESFEGSLYNEWNFARTILRFTADSGAEGDSESFGYSAFFNVAVPSAGFSVTVQGDGKNWIGATIPLAAPHITKFTDLGGGNTLTSISYTYFLNLDETEWLTFHSQWGTGDFSGRDFSSVSVQHFASDFVYFSYNTYLQTGTIVPNGGAASGAFWHLRSNVHTDIRVAASDGNQYGGRADAAVAPLPDEHFGPVTEIAQDQERDYYIESTREVHWKRWVGQSFGTTY